MSTSVATTFVLIVLARITDVTLDTVRTVAIVQGRRVFAAILGFFEAVIYVCAVAKVLLNMGGRFLASPSNSVSHSASKWCRSSQEMALNSQRA